MDDFLSISLLSLAMLVGCYVAGIIPLAVNFSEVRNSRVFFFFLPSVRTVLDIVIFAKRRCFSALRSH